MGIRYDKMLQLFKEKGVTCYTLTKKNKIIGQSTWKKINDGGYIDIKSIDAICSFLQCQPGDLLEWVPDGEE